MMQKLVYFLCHHGPKGWTWMALINKYVGNRLGMAVVFNHETGRYYLK